MIKSDKRRTPRPRSNNLELLLILVLLVIVSYSYQTLIYSGKILGAPGNENGNGAAIALRSNIPPPPPPPVVKQISAYRHANLNLPSVEECTSEQRDKISQQVGLTDDHAGGVSGCQDSSWLYSFFEEEEDIGTESFLGISVGCNKGADAINAARMGMMNPKFDVPTWKDAIGDLVYNCPPPENGKITFARRNGEMHCVEPMDANVQVVNDASVKLGLDVEHFVVTHAAISSRDGVATFPFNQVGEETLSIGCGKEAGEHWCRDVTMYSLDSYVEKFVKSKGPINVLNIDVEGWDFDVLFGASSTLDRTYYLEFEYHSNSAYPSFCD